MSRIPRPLKIGIGGPVGSGKTALAEVLCRRLSAELDMAVITNDIYTKEDAEFLVRRGALPAERVVGVETGGGPPPAVPGGAAGRPPAGGGPPKGIFAHRPFLLPSARRSPPGAPRPP